MPYIVRADPSRGYGREEGNAREERTGFVQSRWDRRSRAFLSFALTQHLLLAFFPSLAYLSVLSIYIPSADTLLDCAPGLPKLSLLSPCTSCLLLSFPFSSLTSLLTFIDEYMFVSQTHPPGGQQAFLFQ